MGPLLGSVRSLYWCDGGYFFASSTVMDWLMVIAIIIITRYLVLEIHSPWPPTHRVRPICRSGLISSDDPPLICPLPFRKPPWRTDLYSVHVAVPVHRRRTIASHQFVWRFHDDDDDEWTRILLQWVRCDNIITSELAVRESSARNPTTYVYLAKRMHFLAWHTGRGRADGPWSCLVYIYSRIIIIFRASALLTAATGWPPISIRQFEIALHTNKSMGSRNLHMKRRYPPPHTVPESRLLL